MLKFRGALDDFEIFPIEDMSEKQTAEVLRESMIFLSFGYPEGFSLPPAEAMACGCIVIGYHGMGGREYFTPEYGFPVEMGDIRGFAHVVEEVIRTCNNNSLVLSNKAKNASAFIRDMYSKEREIEDVVKCWNSILH
jgi:glycosyltransferase involved in cell wall biosynthesis